MHSPVLLQESIDAVLADKRGVYVDCTVNRGGHSMELLKSLDGGAVLVCIDLDKYALEEAKENLSTVAKEKGVTLHFVNDNFRNLRNVLDSLSIGNVNGILADLGVSSQELDSSERGFSFRFDEPLHMTLKSHIDETDLTAIDVVNTWSYETLSSILFSFSDERYANRIAREILKQREVKPITTTFELIDVIKSSVPKAYLYGKTHYATKTFQAIRMAVNDELGAITALIDSLPAVLTSGGKAAVITFHSTEDRLVKHEVRKREETIFFINKKAIVPGEIETKNNRRARSAQLRIIEKI